jgi:exodeoxyribonuclease III
MSAFTVATWNVNSLRVRLEHLKTWLAGHPVDVMALQETKTEDGNFPHSELRALGWHTAAHGQRTYNGVALLARSELTDLHTGIPGYEDSQARVLAATVRGVRIIDVYVPNGQAPGSDKYAYKLAWMAALKGYIESELARHRGLLVLGDFNVAPEDRDVHDPAAWVGSVHVSPPERAALTALGLTDLFRRFAQPERSYSWWDYRQGAFRRDHGLRIDLILANEALARECRSCTIDRAPRAFEQPSDHVPVSAAFALGGEG